MNAAQKNYRRGEDNHASKYTTAEIREVKQMLATARRDVVLARGEAHRISALTGMPVATLRRLASGARWAHVMVDDAGVVVLDDGGAA